MRHSGQTPILFVNSTGDSGSGSDGLGELRYCITQANSAGGSNEVDFASQITMLT